MALRALFAVIVAAAVGIGFILPAPHHSGNEPRSQIAQIELQR